MFAQQLGYAVGDFIWTGGDCHIYSNHMEQVKLQLSRTPRQYPTLKLNKAKDIFSYAYEDIQIVGYDPHPHIPGKVAV
jgi:thymidylate synthase